MKEDLRLLYAVLDTISYDDAWKCFLEKPEEITDEQAELLAEIRYRKYDIYGPAKKLDNG